MTPCGVRGGRRGGEARRASRSGARRASVCGGRPSEVAVVEAVAVAFEGEDLGMVDKAVDHRGGNDVVAEISPHPLKGLLDVTIKDARS